MAIIWIHTLTIKNVYDSNVFVVGVIESWSETKGGRGKNVQRRQRQRRMEAFRDTNVQVVHPKCSSFVFCHLTFVPSESNCACLLYIMARLTQVGQV